jgi:coenzyme F420-reducing hydrogenase gamma subunit
MMRLVRPRFGHLDYVTGAFTEMSGCSDCIRRVNEQNQQLLNLYKESKHGYHYTLVTRP